MCLAPQTVPGVTRSRKLSILSILTAYMRSVELLSPDRSAGQFTPQLTMSGWKHLQHLTSHIVFIVMDDLVNLKPVASASNAKTLARSSENVDQKTPCGRLA